MMMREGFCALFLMLSLLPACASAQILKGFGIRAGLSSSSVAVNFDHNDMLAPHTGWNIATIAEWFSTPMITLRTEVEYTQRGFGIDRKRIYDLASDAPEILGVSTQDSQLDYLSFPVLLRFDASAGVLLRPYLLLGPRADILLQAHQGEAAVEFIYEIDGKRLVMRYEHEQPDVERLRRYVLGGTLGTGLELRWPAVRFVLEVRYTRDFTDSMPDEYSEQTAKNSAWGIGVGMMLR